MDKGGLFNMKIPGTVPTGTELLVVINAEIAKEQGPRAQFLSATPDRDGRLAARARQRAGQRV